MSRAVKLPTRRFAAIAIDPPWDIGAGKRMAGHGVRSDLAYRRNPLPYSTMPLADIHSLPVIDLCADDAWVLLWTTNGLVEEALRTVRAWRLAHVGWLTWVKSDGGPQMPGKWRSTTEFVCVARRGRPSWITTKGFSSHFVAPRPRRTDPCSCERSGVRRCSSCPPRFEHSAKPAEFYSLIRARTVGPRLDMFARRRHDGWEAWGDQVEP